MRARRKYQRKCKLSKILWIWISTERRFVQRENPHENKALLQNLSHKKVFVNWESSSYFGNGTWDFSTLNICCIIWLGTGTSLWHSSALISMATNKENSWKPKVWRRYHRSFQDKLRTKIKKWFSSDLQSLTVVKISTKMNGYYNLNAQYANCMYTSSKSHRKEQVE